MEAWLEFGRGPLFRFCFALMVLGLVRVLGLTLISMVEAYRRNPDRTLPWRDMTLKTLSWLFPLARLWRERPWYSTVSFLFHLGLIPVPLFFSAHVLLWKRGVGIAWPAMPETLADGLTLLVIGTAPILFVSRWASSRTRQISGFQEYFWPLLLATPFVTGYLCAHARIEPSTYQYLMFAHVYSGNLIMVLIPFTKIAHCILMPLSQYVTGVAWKFVPGAGDRVAATLGYADRPTWVERPRVAIHRSLAPTEEA